ALDRLDLPSARRDGLVPLLEAQLQVRRGNAGERARPDTSADRYARRLIRVDSPETRSLAELSAFDLSIDQATGETLAAAGARIARPRSNWSRRVERPLRRRCCGCSTSQPVISPIAAS